MAIERVVEDKRRLFWLLQLGGWSSWTATFYLGILVWGQPPENYYLYLPVIASIGMVLTLALRWVYRITWDRTLGMRAFAILGASYCAGVVWILCRSALFYNLFPEELEKMEYKRAMERANLKHRTNNKYVKLLKKYGDDKELK